MKFEKENTYSGDLACLEFKELTQESHQLAKVNDLWYFVKSGAGRWIAGSGGK